MALDPTNPVVAPPGINPEQLEVQKQMAESLRIVAQGTAGDVVTEGGIYLRMLSAVLMGRLVGSSSDAQIWAADLTRDYLAKYDLDGNPRQAGSAN